MSTYLHENIETMNREDIEKLQSERLVKQVKRMYENVELFRKRMDEKGLKPEDIKGVEDLHKLPFLTTHNVAELKEMGHDKLVTICGLLTPVRQIPTKKDPTKFLKAGVIEDLTGKIEFVAFHKTLQVCNSLILYSYAFLIFFSLIYVSFLF